MNSDKESAPAGILLLLMLLQKILIVKNRETERDGLNLGFKGEILIDYILNYFVSHIIFTLSNLNFISTSIFSEIC